MHTRRTGGRMVWALCLCLAGSLVGSLVLPTAAHAKTAQEIDASANAALDRLAQHVKGAREIVQNAKGVLVLPGVIKAGIGIGGEYGEGALRIRGRTVGYYSIASASIGLQLGAQKKDIIFVFLQDEALRKFQASEGWKVGVDGSVVLVDVGASGSIDTERLNKPIVAFVVGQKGLMYNLTLEGSKISKLKR